MDLPIKLNVQVTKHKGKPCLVLTRKILDSKLINRIVSSAWHDQSVLFVPCFSDKTKSLGSLIDVGILGKDDKGEYKFILKV